ncbi:TPA: hypothetical protein N0F65_007192 [Lagenidium giganteum]|uniref:Serine/threonine-protein phosphatase PGAM5, mitochondrial n=1 Tax=Lagenidium giganteum TaxID=4803 RepID=A0AAV2ZAY7_9STRA|nr:TPA: hypothetical protein N0F65_007192 [Lagenidium giganteum]
MESLSKLLESDAFTNVNGVVCEQPLVSEQQSKALGSAGASSDASVVTHQPAGAVRRNAADVVRREELFGFAKDWNLQRLVDFLRWYDRYENQASTRSAVNDLTEIQRKVDACVDDLAALEQLLAQCMEEHEAARAAADSAPLPSDDDEKLPVDYDPAAALIAVEHRWNELEHQVLEKQQELIELRMHTSVVVEGVPLGRKVHWPNYIRSIQQEHFQRKMQDKVDESSTWHPACIGFTMQKDPHAGSALTEYNKGDILLPPLENYEIDGHTDDSASASEASGEEDNAGDDDDDDDAEAAEAAPSDIPVAPKRSGDDDEEDDEDEKETQDVSAKSTPEPTSEEIPTLDKETLEKHTKDATHAAPTASDQAISYRTAVKRPRVIKRDVPHSFNASLISPVYFGYTPEKRRDEVLASLDEERAAAAKEDAIFSTKLQNRKEKLDATIQSENGKLQSLLQREAEYREKRERFWQKRNAEFERAKKELDPTDIFFRTREAQDKHTREQNAHEDEEIARQKKNIDMRIKKGHDEFDADMRTYSHVRSVDIPLGDSRLKFHEVEMDRYQSEINDARRALVTAKDEYVALKNTKTLGIGGQEAKHRSQLLFAEDQIRSREKELERICTLYDNEVFLFKRAQELHARQQQFLPLYMCLQGEGDSGFTLLDLTFALLVGSGAATLSERVNFLFSMFSSRGHGTKAKAKKPVTLVLSRIAFAQALQIVFDVLQKIGDIHAPRTLSLEHLLGIADREFLKIDISSKDQRDGMTRFEFENYCTSIVEQSKYLCTLLNCPWRFEHLSRYVIQNMSATHQYKLGLINLNDLKFSYARHLIQSRQDLSRYRKAVIHERALAMGENDPLKTDYSKYLPKRRSKLLSNVVPLDHGGYRNLIHYRLEVLERASVKMQTMWRAKKGRQAARFVAEKQAFYHARGVALKNARDTIEKEWHTKDAKPAHSVEKMKFEAKIRMKQVKLRTKGNAFSREQVMALMMEEAVQEAQKEIEKRFREMEEELGYLKHAEAITLPHEETGYLAEEISKALITQVVHAKEETPEVNAMMQTMAFNEEKARKKKQAKANKGSTGENKNEVPETGENVDEIDQHYINEEEASKRQALTDARKLNMVMGRFPEHLYISGPTRDELVMKLDMNFPDPPLRMLQQRLQQICDGMTTLKLTEFLQELPSKRHICAYVQHFRQFDGTYNIENLEKDLYEHFRMVRSSQPLAESLVNIAETDLEFGLTTKLLEPIKQECEQSLGELVREECVRVAQENAEVLQKKLVRMGYRSATPGDSSGGDGMNAVLAQKEQHDMNERKRRVQEAHARVLEAMKAWKEAELSLAMTERMQLRVRESYPVLPEHKTKWAERLQHAYKLPEQRVEQVQQKYTEVFNICNDFIETSVAVALVIIREHHLPIQHKSIFPLRESTIDGRKDDIRTTTRLKYEAHGILFKVCTDDHGRFENSDELAAKYGGHEVRNSALYSRALLDEEKVLTPLQCCVDFMGFRVVCSSKLPIDIITWTDSGSSIQKISRHLVFGSDNRGKSVTFQSKELDRIFASAIAKLNLCRHGARGYQDLTSKLVHAPADMLGYLTEKKTFAVVNFARGMPPEDPDVTPHLIQSTRGMSIMWRQLRPELVLSFGKPLSPDALSSVTYCTPDWQEQAQGVEDATKQLVEDKIPMFARKLSQRPNYFESANFDLVREMHRHGINIRHLGALRANFLHSLSGTATLQYATAEIRTTEDFTREVERGTPVFIEGRSYTVSRNIKHRHDALCITLNEVFMGDSKQNVIVYAGRMECKANAQAIRDVLMVEMIARTFKNLVRHFLRRACASTGTGNINYLLKHIIVQSLNLLSGSRRDSEEFWGTHLFQGIRIRFGWRAVSEVDRQNLRRTMVIHLRQIVSRFATMMGITVAEHCLSKLATHPDCYHFVIEDLAHATDSYRIKHNMSMLHFSMASLLLLRATIQQASSYRHVILADQPAGYWPLCERRGTSIATNVGLYGSAINGRFQSGCVLEAEGPVFNTDVNRSVQFRKEARTYVGVEFVEKCYPKHPDTHVSLEVWCKCDGHESTRRVILTAGRYTLTALKTNMWAVSINARNIDIYAFGSQVVLHTWTHIVGTYNGTMLRLYVNGYLQNEVDVESVVDFEIQKREEIIKKTREDISELENDAKGKLFRDVDQDMQQYFTTKEGRRQIKSVSQKLLDEHEFRVRLSKGGNSTTSEQPAPTSPTKATGASQQASVQPAKRDASKVSRSDFDVMAKKQLLKEEYERRVKAVLVEFTDMRHRVNQKIAKELEEQSTQDSRPIRIGALSSAKRRDGKYFFHGQIAHVVYYNEKCLSRDSINAHYVMGTQDRAHESDRLFSLASSRFSRALEYAADDKKTLEKFAENICASLKYDLDHQHAQEMYKKKVKCGLLPFIATENAHGIAEILKNLPRDPVFSDLFIHCYECLLKINPSYFQPMESLECRLALPELGRMPFAFFLGSKAADCLLNMNEHAAEEVPVFADIIRKVLAEYPTYYGDQLTNMGWVKNLKSARAIVYFILSLEAHEDPCIINLKDASDVGVEDMEIIVRNNRFCVAYHLARCRRVTDIAVQRMSVCCTQVETLDLSYCESITDACLFTLSKHCTRLKRFMIVGCHEVSDLGIEYVVRANRKMEELRLSYCEKMSDQCFATIAKSCPNIAAIEVEMCVQIGNGALKHLATGLSNPTTLRRLNVGGCHRISDEGLLAVARKCTQLQSINLKHCDKLTDASVRVLVHNSIELEELVLEEVCLVTHRIFLFDQEGDGRPVVDRNMIRAMKRLNLIACHNINDMILGHIGHRAKYLEELTISSCVNISDAGLMWLTEDMMDRSVTGTHLVSLDLSYCPQLTAPGIKKVIVQLPKLTSLNLSGCIHLSNAELIEIIDVCSNLVLLEVGYCRELTDEVLGLIAKHLSLETLNLARCVKITDEGMAALTSQFTALKKLNISACKHLTDSTLLGLLDGCKAIEELDITHCPHFSHNVLQRFSKRNVRIVQTNYDSPVYRKAESRQSIVETDRQEDGNNDELSARAGEDGNQSHGLMLGVITQKKPAFASKRLATHAAERPKRVLFSDADGGDLEDSVILDSSEYPSPAKEPVYRVAPHVNPVWHLEPHHVELLFTCEDQKLREPSSRDYGVTRVEQRQDAIMCGYVLMEQTTMWDTRWTNFWAEVYPGVLILHRHKEAFERKRQVVLIAGADVQVLSTQDNALELTLKNQKRRILRVSTLRDLLLWQWSLQLAAKARSDPKRLHQAISITRTAPYELLDESRRVGNVAFPRFLNAQPSYHHILQRNSTQIIFVRHGETENMNFRVPDSEKRLTHRGREQARLTARYLERKLRSRSGTRDNVELVHSTLHRAVETASIFATEMPWIEKRHECVFLEDGAPQIFQRQKHASADYDLQLEYRDALHNIAFELICHRVAWMSRPRSHVIVVGHASFIQFCIAQFTNMPVEDVVHFGAPISHCSITQIEVLVDDVQKARVRSTNHDMSDKDREELAFLRVENSLLRKKIKELERIARGQKSGLKFVVDEAEIDKINELLRKAESAKEEAMNYVANTSRDKLGNDVKTLQSILKKAKAERNAFKMKIKAGEEKLRSEKTKIEKDELRFQVDREIFAKIIQDDRDGYKYEVNLLVQKMNEIQKEKFELYMWAKQAQERYLQEIRKLTRSLGKTRKAVQEQSLQSTAVLNQIHATHALVFPAVSEGGERLPTPTTAYFAGAKSDSLERDMPQLEYRSDGRRRVHFSDAKGLELADYQLQETTYYATPSTARQVTHNGSTRRIAGDEIELLFSEETSFLPVPRSDYAVMKLEQRDEVLVCGCVQMKKVKMGITIWKNCWAELYHGIIILRKYKDTIQRKRTLLPIAACRVELLNVDENMLELTYKFQMQEKKRILRLRTKSDMFLWWWVIQLGSKSRFDEKVLHRSVSRTTTLPLQMLEDSHKVENVLFPRSFRMRNPHRALRNPSGRQGVTHLILIRHGEAENIHFRVADREKKLTQRGKEQALISAHFLNERLQEVMADSDNVELIYGGLERSVETAAIFAKSIPWLDKKYECCFLEDGAPKNIDPLYRNEYRDSMHKMAFEFICRWDASEEEKPVPMQQLESYKIVICHTSFVQFCIAQCYQIPKEIVQLGSPINHCSITQMDVMKDDKMNVVFSNRVTHLPLTHRTSD